jgi:APA family basic amino acid/polyamine antiporter
MLLERRLGLVGAVGMGLGAMIGTGVFVSIGLGAGIAGPAVLLALCLAALIAICNGLSSAQLAAAHPVSGGTYEYGYRYLHPSAGFTAGWVFLAAKSASAATAALGFAGYLLNAAGQPPTLLVPVAFAVLAAIASVVLAGLRSSNVANGAMVLVTILALLFFIAAGAPWFDAGRLTPFFEGPAGKIGPSAFLEATALMFVAYTGYARIATLGEEVVNPTRTIPLAIIASALIAMILYVAVTFVGIGVSGSAGLLTATETDAAPLAVIARQFAPPGSGAVLVIGGLTAMLGVLLNLLLGLSRVVLAMARRKDMPGVLATLNDSGTAVLRRVGRHGAHRGTHRRRRHTDHLVVQRVQRADLLLVDESCGAADAARAEALPTLGRGPRAPRLLRARILGGAHRVACRRGHDRARARVVHRGASCAATRRLAA